MEALVEYINCVKEVGLKSFWKEFVREGPAHVHDHGHSNSLVSKLIQHLVRCEA